MQKLFSLISLTALFILFQPLTSQAQKVDKKYQSLLWEVVHPDNPSKVSYLYGTMHVSSKLAFNLSDTFFIGLNNADIIALESEPTKWLEEVMDLKYATEYFGSYPGYTYTSKGFYQRIFPLSMPQNSELGSMISSRDMMSNSLQFRSNPYMKDFEEDTYLDMFIYMAGAKTQRTVLGLEDIIHTNDLHRLAKSERRSKKDEKPIPLWLEEKMKDMDIGDIFEDSYRQQDLDLMMELQNLFSSEHYIKWFLDERNRLMADSMFVLMKKNSVFAGVGAAHLAGEFGMIEYLRRMGCKVRAVKFLKTDYATDEKKRYDSLKTNITLTNQVSPDGQFSVSLPAKLYELPYSGKNYLASEMTNGSFFSVNKVNTYNIISGLTPDRYLEKIDSLLFENIPGKTLSKTKISNGPFKGVEIKNKTKTGDHQHYQIYATPFEVIIFKIGGTGDFILDWSDSIFSTLKFNDFTKKAEWQRHSFVYGGFSVEMPTYRVFDNNSPVSAAYNHPVFQALDPKTENQFMVTRNVLIDYYYLEEDDFELERTADKLAQKHKKEVIDKKFGKHQGRPFLDFTLVPKKDEKGETIHFRMVIAGGHYYLLAANIKKDKKQLKQFFESFRIEPFSNLKPLDNFTDTSLYFSTLTSKEINESNVRMPRYGDKPKDYESFSEVYNYKSESGERINVYFKKFHQYEFYPDSDSVFSECITDFTEDNSLVVYSEKRLEKGNNKIMDLMLSDTGSIRLIKIRVFLKNQGDAIYAIRTLVDSVSKSSPFIDGFYENFTPKDTTMGMSIFEDKGSLFLDDLFSEDSTNFKKAMNSVKKVSFSNANVDRVISILETYPFKDKKQEFIQQIILKKISKVEDEKLIDFSKKLYFENSNNYPIQIGAIEILCAQKTTKAIRALAEIMEKDLPFIMDNDRYILSPMRYDSVQLWKQLYPKMFEYDHIEEYKSIIFYDLSNMLDSNKIDANFYKSFLPKLIEESEFILKKHLANEQKKRLEKEKTDAINDKKTSGGSSSSNWSLIQKYKLLLPHISDQEIAALIAKYEKGIESEPDKISMIKFRLVNKLEVDKIMIANIAKNPDYLIQLYKALDEVNRLDLIPSEYLNDEHLAKLTLNNSSNYGYYRYGSSYDIDKDTFKLIKQEEMSIRGKKYKIYYYEISQVVTLQMAEKQSFDPKDYKKIAIIAVEIKDNKVYPVGSKYKSTVKIENPERWDKYLEELTEGFIVKDRKRASATEIDDGYFDFW